MQCRYCANEPADYRKKIPSLSRRLRGIKAELLMFNYEESFEQVAGPCITGRDTEGNVTGFTATQCVLYTHIKNGWQVAVHPCFEKGGIIFRAKGAATKPNDAEAFADFFKLVMRDGETRGRKGGLTVGQIVSCLRELGDEADGADEERLGAELSRTAKRIKQVLKAEGKTLDDCKRLAREQPGPRTVTVPLVGANVKPGVNWTKATDGKVAEAGTPDSEPGK